MVGRARTALKFFVYGLIVGLLFAPRSGAETRQQALDWAGQTIKNVLGSGDASDQA
jgi:gas vesicle protein